MKSFSFLILLISIGLATFAQDPVSWKYEAVKLAEGKYEIRFKAQVDQGWHIFSQKQPADAIASPTTISFQKNPLIIVNGKILEIGRLEKTTDPTVGVSAWQFSNSVEYKQKISLKGKVKTVLNGTIEYQACTEGKCLLPVSIPFSLKLN